MPDIKITKPEDCIVGCSFPLSKKDFLYQLTEGHEGNFIHYQFGHLTNLSQEGLWDLYSDFAEVINETFDKVSQLGVTVIKNFGIEDLTKINGFEVFTLFAHYDWETNELDLANQVMNKEFFTEIFPKDYHGILDLSVCEAVFIRDELKKKIGNQVISFKVKVPITQLILLYKQLIINLKRVDINYIDCYKEIIIDLSKKKHMSELSNLLTRYKAEFTNSFKGSKDIPEITSEEKARFIEQLKIISGKNRIFLWINVGMLLVTFIGSILVIYRFLDKPENLPKIFGATGITISGMIYYMTYLWRQIVGIDLTITMADKLDPKSLPTIINSLLSTIKKPCPKIF